MFSASLRLIRASLQASSSSVPFTRTPLAHTTPFQASLRSVRRLKIIQSCTETKLLHTIVTRLNSAKLQSADSCAIISYQQTPIPFSIPRQKSESHALKPMPLSLPLPQLPLAVQLPHAASKTIADRRKLSGCSEDASVLVHRDNVTLFAVFDGVGSLRVDYDIDASLFSTTMAQAVRQAFLNDSSLSVSSLLAVAWHSVVENRLIGSSTALIIKLDCISGKLESVNIGDSCYTILRPSAAVSGRFQIHYQSTEQLHYFNCPAQLGISTDHDISNYDSIDSADYHTLTLQAQDVLCITSDGFHDNISETELEQAVNQHYQINSHSIVHSSLCNELVEFAFARSWDSEHDSPFAQQAKEANICWHEGGRKDDITVIVATRQLPTRNNKQ